MSTTISERVNELYAKSHRNFANDVEWHVRYGYMYCTPDHLIMFSRVGDGWFIHLAVVASGSITDLLAYMPYWLPHIGWSRDPSGLGELVWYSTEKVLKHL